MDLSSQKLRILISRYLNWRVKKYKSLHRSNKGLVLQRQDIVEQLFSTVKLRNRFHSWVWKKSTIFNVSRRNSAVGLSLFSWSNGVYQQERDICFSIDRRRFTSTYHLYNIQKKRNFKRLRLFNRNVLLHQKQLFKSEGDENKHCQA